MLRKPGDGASDASVSVSVSDLRGQAKSATVQWLAIILYKKRRTLLELWKEETYIKAG